MKSKLSLAFCVLSLSASSVHAATSGSNGSHDPSRMLQSDGKLYIYSTGGGGKVSSDGLSWKDVASPPWNRSLANNQGIWAPDGIQLNGRFLLFGSMWNSAKASRLILLTTPSLDPTKADWTDVGTIVDGPSGVTHSVIDPAPVLDEQGNLYVVWGGGYPFPDNVDSIFLTRLDNETGKAVITDPGYQPPNSPGYALKQGHKEGPYIHRHGADYFLFYQTGGCCSGASSTYTVHVSRATDIKGPYTGDKTFYASRGGIHGPGHMGIYDACGYQRFTYHYYPDSGNSVIGENDLMWGADGWPAVGPESTAPIKPCPAGEIGSGAGTSGSGAGGSAGAGGSPGVGGTSGSNGGGTSSSANGGNASAGSNGAGLGNEPGTGGSASGEPLGNSGHGGASNSGVAGASGSAGVATSSPGTPNGSESDAGGCTMALGSRQVTHGAWSSALPLLGLLARRRRRAGPGPLSGSERLDVRQPA